VLSAYRKLLEDISRLYVDAKKSQVRFTWETGRRIVEVEQDGAVRAEYGTGLIQKLSEELTQRHGEDSGFSETNLKRMRQFYLLYPKGAEAQNTR
jgi:hypothetical protein